MSFLAYTAHDIGQARKYNKPINGAENAKHLARYLVDTSGGPVTITLPLNAPIGFKFWVKDYARTFDTANCVIANNGEKIMNVLDSYTLDTKNTECQFEKINAEQGWLVS